MKALKDAAKAASRSSSSEMEDLKELAQAYIDSVDTFMGSQKGLDNFKTDQNKINDPFYAEFYAFYDASIGFVQNVAIHPEFVEEFFSQNNVKNFAVVSMIFGRISQRAYALEAARSKLNN